MSSAPVDEATAGLPQEPPLPPMDSVGFLRWTWRQLTSMRTALILLFLLAIASVPGSVFPQRGSNPLKVDQWLANNPKSGPILDKLGFFDVFAAPWFAAVYLLLFISLIGCVVPRVAKYAQAVRTPPPPAPRQMGRMPALSEFLSTSDTDALLNLAARSLRRRRWRVRTGISSDGSRWVAAEKGYLREVGNLVFHLSLLFILIAVAVGGLFGWKGNVIVREGTGFSNSLTQYDAWGGGRFVDPDTLPPFSFTLESFKADFERGDAQRGAPRLFEADIRYRESPGADQVKTTIEVNEPLKIDGAKVFLVGHGYAPHLVVRDATGAVVFDDSVVFLPQDGNFTSTGVVKVPDANPSLGFSGVFLPTAEMDPLRGGFSSFPASDNPVLLLGAFRGDLGMDAGVPQNVYKLDTAKMVKIGLDSLKPGETWTLPGKSGSITFSGLDRYATFQIAFDPGKELALGAVTAALAGLILSLFVRRRRIWVKVSAEPGRGFLVQVAALAKNEGADLSEDVTALADHLAGSDAADDRRAP